MHEISFYLVLVWAKTEVLDSLTGVLGTSEKQSVASSGRTESQLIQSQDLSSSGENAGASSGGEPESSDAELRDSQEAVVIGDGTNDHDGALIIITRSVGNDSGDRDWGSVDAGHEESAEDNLVEGGLGSAWTGLGLTLRPDLCKTLTGQEPVQLHEELEVCEVVLSALHDLKS